MQVVCECVSVEPSSTFGYAINSLKTLEQVELSCFASCLHKVYHSLSNTPSPSLSLFPLAVTLCFGLYHSLGSLTGTMLKDPQSDSSC